MPKLVANAAGALLVVCALTGCDDIASFSLAPYSDVTVVASARKVSYHDFEIHGRTTFVHFRYAVTLKSDIPLYFKVENIPLLINGRKSRETYYDTYASVAPHWQRIKKGETVIDSYAVFSGRLDETAIAVVEFK